MVNTVTTNYITTLHLYALVELVQSVLIILLYTLYSFCKDQQYHANLHCTCTVLCAVYMYLLCVIYNSTMCLCVSVVLSQRRVLL
jgi:hypothetical protein